MKNDKHSCVEQNKCSFEVLFIFDKTYCAWSDMVEKYDNITLLFIQTICKKHNKNFN